MPRQDRNAPRSVIRRPEPRQRNQPRETQQRNRRQDEIDQAGAQPLHPGRGWTHGKKK